MGGQQERLHPSTAETQPTHHWLKQAGTPSPLRGQLTPLPLNFYPPRVAFEQDITGGSTSHLGECEGECMRDGAQERGDTTRSPR